MKQKLRCILLIDDHEADNFLHTYIIEHSGHVEEVVAVQSGQAALNYLQSTEDGSRPRPELIFLDINMPAMSGWEFLEEYKQRKQSQVEQTVVIMLTTSINPDDARRARNIQEINGFYNKPLTVEMFEQILQQHFPERW